MFVRTDRHSHEPPDPPGPAAPPSRSPTLSSRLLSAPKWAVLAAGAAVCCSLPLTTGCGPDYKARGQVKGTVKAGQKLLTSGTVMFYNEQGMTGAASIDPDGNYVMVDAPVGDCKVTVTVPSVPNDPTVMARLSGKGKGPKMPTGDGMRPPDGAEMSEGADAGGPPPPLARIPTEIVLADAKYASPETSGLKFTIRKGDQHTFNIEMDPGPEPPKMGKGALKMGPMMGPKMPKP